MDAAADLPVWLRALEPLAVPFVILLMLAGWLLERRRDRERRRRHDARMRANAYELAEIVERWTVRWPGWTRKEGIRVDAHRIIGFCREIAGDAPTARQLARELVTDAPAASDDLAEMAREVYPRVASVARFMEGMAELDPEADHGEEWERMMPGELDTYRAECVQPAFRLLASAVSDLRRDARI